jgi:ribosomal protein L1
VTNFLRKRHFPFPVRITGIDANQVKKNIQEVFDTVGLLISGGSEFIIRCAKTESMSVKDIVKNAINCSFKAVCLIISSQKTKHNYVKEVSISTTKSIALPIFQHSDNEHDE